LNGTELREVTTGVNRNCLASDWSPSGNDLVFVCDNETGTDRDVWLAHQNGRGLTQLTHTPSQREAFPSFSPDGSAIVFGRIVATGVFNIFSIDLGSGDEQLLLADAPPMTYSVAYPTWQPLGQ
jgi:Tol biopolymer transport system component